MRKSKHLMYLYSAFCKSIENYPYLPFFARNNNEAVYKFMNFLRKKEYVPEDLELHLIGTCEIYGKELMPENLQPLIVPMKVEIKNNFFAKTVTLGMYYQQLLLDYIKTFKENYLCKNHH
ncbi:hypothetical protein [Microvirus mar37]|uniref:Uncharacterized protein n=1 Tax=Microvirus mar37 TaxID=2851171 RepID=A0A8F5RCR2_9VIRU|nr:hypothetical protein [Microvirus mar37]